MNPLDRLIGLREKDERLVLGLSSGTSADGVDAALVRIRGNGTSLSLETVLGRTYPYGEVLQKSVTALGTADTAAVCRLNFVLGEFFADCAKRIATSGEATLTA